MKKKLSKKEQESLNILFRACCDDSIPNTKLYALTRTKPLKKQTR